MTQYGQRNDEYANHGVGYDGGGGGIRVSAIPSAFVRQLLWAVPLLLGLVLLCFWFTRNIERQYVAEGRILVQLGSEYVYNPLSGSGGANPMLLTSDQIVLTEIGIIKNSAIIDQVINQMIASPANGGVGGDVFAPKLYKKWAKASRADKVDRWNNMVKSVERAYGVSPKPKSSIVNLSYKHPNGDVAVKTLDAFMSAYSTFRKQTFVISETGQVGERRADTEAQLADIESKIQRILNKNGVSDFASEQTGVQRRAETLTTQLNTLRGNLSAAEAALAASEDQLRNLPKTIDLYVDDRASQRLAQARLEKRQLLAKYLPTSNPVRAKDAEISQLQAQVDSNGGQPKGGRRVGPNPTYQTQVTQRNTYQATADSLREQEITLQAQVNAAVAKVKRLRILGPRYANLLREKKTVEARLQGLQARENESLIDEKQLEGSSDNIKFITRPSMPRKGRNMRKIMFALSSVAAAFSVFMLALLRVFLDPRIYGPGTSQRMATSAPVAEEVYYNSVPEGVPGPSEYQPEYAPKPEPAYAPAAYGGGGAIGGYAHAHSQSQDPYGQTGYVQSPYGAPSPVEYVNPYAQDTGGQIYADGSPSAFENVGTQVVPVQSQVGDNPYTGGTAGGALKVGPDENIPVLGTPSDENSKPA